MCGGKRCVYRDLVGKSDGKRPLGKPRHKWQYNKSIKYILSVDSIHVIWFRDNCWDILKTVMSDLLDQLDVTIVIY